MQIYLGRGQRFVAENLRNGLLADGLAIGQDTGNKVSQFVVMNPVSTFSVPGHFNIYPVFWTTFLFVSWQALFLKTLARTRLYTLYKTRF